MPFLKDVNFRYTPTKIRPIWIILVVIIIVAIFYVGNAYDNEKNKSFFKHIKFTKGTIVGTVPRQKYVYKFIINGVQYEDKTNIGQTREFFHHSIVGMEFTVAYDSLNPYENLIMIYPNDYKSIGLKVPDSLAERESPDK
jgi:hypothetical protein